MKILESNEIVSEIQIGFNVKTENVDNEVEKLLTKAIVKHNRKVGSPSPFENTINTKT